MSPIPSLANSQRDEWATTTVTLVLLYHRAGLAYKKLEAWRAVTVPNCYFSDKRGENKPVLEPVPVL